MATQFMTNPSQIDETVRKASIAAALAVQKDAQRLGDVVQVAATTAAAAGASPEQAAAIALDIEKQVQSAGTTGNIGVEAGERAALAANSTLSPAAPPAASAAIAPTVPTEVLYRALMQLCESDKWTPMAELAEFLRIGEDAARAALSELVGYSFVIIKDGHFYLTESGRRYILYTSAR